MQQASFDSWLDYPTILQLEIVLRTRVHYSPLQYTTEDPPPSSYGRAILGTHTYLEAFSSFHLLVYELYRQPSSPLPRTPGHVPTAPNDVNRVPEIPNGYSVHRATYLPHHSPPLRSALSTASSRLQTPETTCNSWTEN